jgi:hypothetical protein
MTARLVLECHPGFALKVVASVGAPFQHFPNSGAYIFGIEEGNTRIRIGFKHHPVTGPQILIPQVDVNKDIWNNIIKEYVAVALYGYLIPGKFEEDPGVHGKEFFICTLPASLPAEQVARIISDASHLCLHPHKQEQEVVKKAMLVSVMVDLEMPEFIRPDAEADEFFDAREDPASDSDASLDVEAGYKSEDSFNLEEHPDLTEHVRVLILD